MQRIDLHLHTEFSPDADAQATVDAVCRSAISKGVGILCITDHIDIGGDYDTYDNFDFLRRNAEITRAQEKYADKLILLNGLEFGEPNLHKDIAKDIFAYNYDMVLGSVHYPCEMYWQGKISVAEMSQMHYVRTLDMVRSGGFDVLAHLDFPKKFVSGFISNAEYTTKILQQCVKNGIVLEVNTSYLRRGGSDTLPSRAALQQYADLGGKYVTIGSDSHNVSAIAENFVKVYAQLPLGLKLCYFKQRKMIDYEL